ncbi:ArnT family glycosyltransferase [Desulfocurvus vexinensis]|uniref:ArnT family glycosyltransferase n=1 Tax=Desulfocurvus vexinensis TaxID=399548 RepID=UPI0004B8292B|nr:glycosyltransferase family 39 protein [Desulfocurvus vexinensis]
MDKLLTRLYRLLAWAPLLLPAALLAAQTVPVLDSRALWFSDEIRYANVFENVVHGGKWLVMYLNGVPYPDKPPVYFWFLAGLLPVFKAATPALFMAGAALSALLLLTATMALSRLVARAGREVSLGAGLVLVSCFYVVGLAHYSRMDLLFATLITAAHICLFRAWGRERAMGWAVAGFALAGVATLTKGPLGLAFPLLASVAYLAWTGNLRRFFRRDVAVGLGVCLGLLGAWVLAAWLGGERELVENIFYKQIYRRAVNASHHGQPFWHYLATLPAAWLPWTLLLAALPLGPVARAGFWRGLWQARRDEERKGQAYLWSMVLTGFVLLSALSTKIIVYLLPLFPALAVLSARAVLGLDARRTRRLWLVLCGLFAVVAMALPFGNMLHPWPDFAVAGLWWMALASALAAGLLWWAARALGPASGLLLAALVVTAWVQPLAMLTLPSLDPVMSPRAQAQVMGDYADQGYVPAAYKIYSGVYTYYSGHDVLETQDLERIAALLAAEPKVVLGMQRRYWDQWTDRPATLNVIHEQWIVDQPYVLAVQGGPAAPQPQAPDAGADAGAALAPGAAANATGADPAPGTAPQAMPGPAPEAAPGPDQQAAPHGQPEQAPAPAPDKDTGTAPGESDPAPAPANATEQTI